MRQSRIVASLCFVSSALFAQLQTNTGAVQGTVTDSSGAAIVGAKVTVVSPGLQGELVYTTNEQGSNPLAAISWIIFSASIMRSVSAG
jgi:hypothetical protein